MEGLARAGARLKRFSSAEEPRSRRNERPLSNGHLATPASVAPAPAAAEIGRDTNRLEGEIEPSSLLLDNALESHSEDPPKRITIPVGSYFPGDPVRCAPRTF